MSEGLSHQHLTSDIGHLDPGTSSWALWPNGRLTGPRWPNAISALGNASIKNSSRRGWFVNWRTGRGRRAESLAEGLLLGDERALTECNATSQFDSTRTTAKVSPEQGSWKPCVSRG